MEKAEHLTLAEPCLVLLIGPSGSGKSSFAHRNFKRTAILSSDSCRALVCDNESDQAATDDAFELLHLMLRKRLQRHLTTVVDATNVQPFARAPLLAAARECAVPCVAIVFDLPEQSCLEHNRQRPGRQVPPDIIREQITELHNSLPLLPEEGFHRILLLQTAEEVERTRVHS